MTRKRKPYKTYPKEFKLETDRLMRDSDRPARESEELRQSIIGDQDHTVSQGQSVHLRFSENSRRPAGPRRDSRCKSHGQVDARA
jgi:hypothetical protein